LRVNPLKGFNGFGGPIFREKNGFQKKGPKFLHVNFCVTQFLLVAQFERQEFLTSLT